MSRLTRTLQSPLPSAGDIQIVIQDGFPRLRDANGVVYRLRAEPGGVDAAGVDGDMVFDETGLHVRVDGAWETLAFAE